MVSYFVVGLQIAGVRYILILFFAVTAVFTLAYKLRPSIIFVDEVDSFLGQRKATEHEAVTNMKTEFMALWDGFTTDRKYQNYMVQKLHVFIKFTYLISKKICAFILHVFIIQK